MRNFWTPSSTCMVLLEATLHLGADLTSERNTYDTLDPFKLG